MAVQTPDAGKAAPRLASVEFALDASGIAVEAKLKQAGAVLSAKKK